MMTMKRRTSKATPPLRQTAKMMMVVLEILAVLVPEKHTAQHIAAQQ